ncbi:MAG: serine/threonine-protein kinase [Acidimicrobiales bacterium]
MGTIDAGALLDDRYRIIARRASGATATVWETQDEFLRRRVAVKILFEHLAADDQFMDRFVDEARTAATVNHPNLVAVYDSITDHPGMVLEWIDGPDLRQRLDESTLEPSEAASIGAAIADGLAALHAHGLVHRDVKPANILLTATGVPKLTDFGIATANAGDRTATGIVLGTAKYLAPEQVRGGEIDGRADVFALAAVLYEALSGTPPWSREGDLPTALARLEEDPRDLRITHPHLPEGLTGAVMRGLSREPSDRWPTAAAFATALRGSMALRGGSTLPPPPIRTSGASATVALPAAPTPALPAPSPTARPGPRVRYRRKRWPRVVGLLIVAAIAALGWSLVAAIDSGDDASDGSPAGSTNDGNDGTDLVIARSNAFDPEGTGAPGEHNDRALFAIDGDPSTVWTTERYSSRDLGSKSGVGLVLTLDREQDIRRVTVHTADAQDWALEVRVASGITVDDATSIGDFGEVRGTGSGLGTVADVSVSGRGDTVVVWLTDLGAGFLPISLAITEVTIG